MSLVVFEEKEKGIGVITLKDPDNLNAMGEEMAADFRALVSEIQNRRDKLRVLVLTGAGRAFSAGGNLQMLKKKSELSGEENRRRMMLFYNSFLNILSLELPLIAAINGHAIGAGLCVASACDVRVVAENAKLGFTFTKLALHPGMGATFFLPRLLGYGRAAELLLTGRVISGKEAVSIGLASSAAPAEEVLSVALGIAEEISSCGPEATRQLLGSMRLQPETLVEALEREALCQSVNYASEEFMEGVTSVIEKRPAKFS